jgi:hypothetical protein
MICHRNDWEYFNEIWYSDLQWKQQEKFAFYLSVQKNSYISVKIKSNIVSFIRRGLSYRGLVRDSIKVSKLVWNVLRACVKETERDVRIYLTMYKEEYIMYQRNITAVLVISSLNNGIYDIRSVD